MFAAKDTSQLKMLDGYPEGKYCQYSSQRSLCYEAEKKTKQKTTTTIKKTKHTKKIQRFNESLGVI